MTIKIEYKQPRFYKAEGVQLAPGMNIVSEDRAKQFLANPGTKARIEKGDIVVHAAAATDAASGEPTAKELAREVIPSSFDTNALRVWADDERKTVADAANKRLAELAGGDDDGADS